MHNINLPIEALRLPKIGNGITRREVREKVVLYEFLWTIQRGELNFIKFLANKAQ